MIAMSPTRFLSLLAGVLLTATLLAGCATKRDHYDVPDIPLPSQFPKAPSSAAMPDGQAPGADAALTTSAALAFAQALPEWWRLLGSSELDGLIGQALEHNPELRIMGLRLAQSRARAGQALSDQVPLLTAPIQVSRSAPVNGIGTVGPGERVASREIYQPSLRAEWRVDLWGERQSMADSAALQVWQAAFQRDDVQRNLIAGVANGYATYLSLNDRLRVAKETDAALSGMLAAVEARLEKGDATVTDMVQQRAAVYAVKATIPTLEQQRDEALSNLGQLLGALPGSLQLSEQGLEQLLFPSVLPGVPSALLLRRPDVRFVEARLLAADADIDVARARLLPPLDLSVQVGYGSLYMSQLFQPYTFFRNVIANLSATIFDKGRRAKDVDFANAAHQELVESYLRVIYTAIREVDDWLNAIQKTGKSLQAQRESADAARLAWEYSRESYDAGAIDYLTLLDTQRTYYRSLDDLHRIRSEHYRAMINLFAALGGGIAPGAPLPGPGQRPAALADGQDGAVIVGRVQGRIGTAPDGWDWESGLE